LREIDNPKNEKALIFLEEGNYKTLDQELKDNYNLSIDDLKIKGEFDVPIKIRKPKLGKLKYTQIYKKFEIVCQEEKINYTERLKEFDFEKIKKMYPYDSNEKTAHIGRKGLTSEVSNHFITYVKLYYEYQDLIYDLAKFTYGKFTESDLLNQFDEELKEIYSKIKNEFEWINNHPTLEITDVIKDIAGLLMIEISYKIEIIKEDAEIELLEWAIPAFIFYGNGKFLPPIKREDVERLQKRPHRLEEDFEDANLDPQDISFNYIPYRFDSDFEINALREMLKLAELKNLEIYYNGHKDNKLQSFYIKTDLGNYTPDFLIVKRKDNKKYKDEHQKGDIEKVLILETKSRIFYNEDFKRKEKFVKDIFLKHNPKFKYERFIDEDGENDFKKHLEKVRNLINSL
jgi:hypothetical protein